MTLIKVFICEECERVAFPADDGGWGHRCTQDNDFYVGMRCESFLMPAEVEGTELFVSGLREKHKRLEDQG